MDLQWTAKENEQKRQIDKLELPVVDRLIVDVFGDKGAIDSRPVDDGKKLNEEVLSRLKIGVHPSDDELQHQLLRQRPRFLHQEKLKNYLD